MNTQTILFDKIKIECFAELIIRAAKSCVIGLNEGESVCEPVISKRRAELTVSIDVCPSGKSCSAVDIDWIRLPKVQFEIGHEVDIFSKIFLRSNKIVFELSCELLDAFAESAADGYVFELPEMVFIPKPGIAPDREASAYARAIINAYLHLGAPKRRTEASDFALMCCLMLFGMNGAALEKAHSTATRAVLRALDEGSVNDVSSAAMAAALKYAEGHSAKS